MTTGILSLIETWVAFGADNPENADAPIQCGVRFPGVMVPKASTIHWAKLKLVASDAVSTTTVNSNIKGEDADNAVAFTTGVNFVARARTSASVAWDAIAGWTAGVVYQSPDISSVIQEIVNRAGWVSGNSMVIFIEDDGSSANAYREFAAWDHLTYAAAILEIYFT